MLPNGAADEEDDDAGASEQDLLVVLKLSNKQMGTNEERQEIDAFSDELAAAVEAAGVGEFDGDELGAGECTLFFCGTDLDKMLAVLRPLLKRSPLCRGAQIVRMVPDAHGRMTTLRSPV